MSFNFLMVLLMTSAGWNALFLVVGNNLSNCRNCHEKVGDTLRSSCSVSCSCQKAANPFYKFGKTARTSDVTSSEVTSCVTSMCAHENQTCLSKSTELCQQEYSNFSFINSIPYFGSLKAFQKAGICIFCFSNKNVFSVSLDAFDKHKFMNALILDHNFISNVSWLIGLRNISLFYLDLSFNHIHTLRSYAFLHVQKLIWLDLRHNHIESIESNVFDGMKDLQLLDLSCNSLRTDTIQGNSFNGLSSLLHLSLAKNHGITKLMHFKKVGLTNSKLETLDLHGLSNMQSVDSFALSGLEFLLTLNLSYCRLKNLNLGWLSDGPEKSLETLDLSHNFLTSIKTSYFNSLKINKSRQQRACDIMQSTSCQLPYIVSPSIYSADCNLRLLGYQSCLLYSQKAEFYQPLPRLSWLSISGNCYLKEVEADAFKHLPSLQYLFLQNCNISKMKIADEVHQFQNNGINVTLPLLEGVWVAGNPMRCDCHVRLLLEWSKTFNSPNSNCLNSSEKVLSNHHLVDGAEYFYKNRCHYVHSPGISQCHLDTSLTKIPIETVLYSLLSCPEEPASMFVILLIGPVTFAVSISLIGICGICAVILRRLRKHQSGFYLTQSFEQRKHTATVVLHRKEVKSGKRTVGAHFFHSKAKSSPNIGTRLTPAPSPRLNYKTNIVLGKLGESQGRGMQSPLLSSMTRSPSSSPRIRQKRDSSNSQSSLTSRDHRHQPIRKYLSIPHHRKNYSLKHSATPVEKLHQETKFISSPSSTRSRNN